MKILTKQCFRLLLSAVFALSIAACGDDSNSNGGRNETSAILTGTVATGAPLDGILNITGSAGQQLLNVTIAPDGSFSVNVAGLTAPFMLEAVPNDPALAKLYSFATDVNVTVNVTPLTNLAMFMSNGNTDAAALFADWVNKAAGFSSAALLGNQAIINANFQALFQASGLDAITFDFFKAVFAANGAGIDGVMDLVSIDISGGNINVSISGNPAFAFDLSIDVSGIQIGGGTGGGIGIDITVGSGLTPTYSWTGGNVTSLTVVRTSNVVSPVWGITTVASDGLTSPVTHGQAPNAALETFATELTLTAGVQYRVSVVRLDGSTGFTDFTLSGGGSAATFTVGGTVTAATNKMVLQNNGVDDLLVAGTSFTFATALSEGSVYQVTVFKQPIGQTCTVSNGSGTISGANVTNVGIVCSDTGGTGGGTAAAITVGTGLTPNYSWSGANVQMISVARASDPTNPVWQVTRPGEGISSPIRHGQFVLGGVTQSAKELILTPGVQYQVKFLRAPATISSPVDFTPSGAASAFTVGGSLSGAGVGVTRPNNNFSLIMTRADGNFSFFSPFVDGTSYTLPMTFAPGESYDVTIRFHPPGKTCTVANGSGTVSGANVTDVAITCVSSGTIVPSGTIVNPGGLQGQWEFFIDDIFVNDGPLTDGPVTFTTSPVSNSSWFELRISNSACTLPFRIPTEGWAETVLAFRYKIDCS